MVLSPPLVIELAVLCLLPVPPLLLTLRYIRAGCGVLDAGVAFGWIVFLYVWFPLLGVFLAQQGIGPPVYPRINVLANVTEEIAYVAICGLAALTGFCAVYGRFRTYEVVEIERSTSARSGFIAAIPPLILVFAGFGVAHLVLWPEHAAGYAETYARVARLPRLQRQALGLIAHVRLPLLLVAIAYLLAWRRGSHLLVLGSVFAALVLTLVAGGSRTFGFLSVLAYLVFVSIYVRPVRARYLVVVAIASLVLFSIAGILRPGSGWHGQLPLLQEGEFVSLFLNPVDILHRTLNGKGQPLPHAYFIDLMRLVPQQFLPVQKVDPSVWYLATYYPKYLASGGGMCFGLLTESVGGYGIPEAFVRGAALGLLLALVSNRCLSGVVTPLKAAVYVWIFVMCYQSFRDTTFVLVYRFVYHVLPGILLVGLSARLMRPGGSAVVPVHRRGG
jgi:hypothetical protein